MNDPLYGMPAPIVLLGTAMVFLIMLAPAMAEWLMVALVLSGLALCVYGLTLFVKDRATDKRKASKYVKTGILVAISPLMAIVFLFVFFMWALGNVMTGR